MCVPTNVKTDGIKGHFYEGIKFIINYSSKYCANKQWSLGQYSSLVDYGHGV
jgi:hypothetical protein